ncbi:MAG: hypothetical protein ABI333_12580 [bacterium]
MTQDSHDQAPHPEDLEALARWEPPASPGSLVALLPNKWIRRLVLGAIPVLAVCFGSGLIAVSQLGLSHSLQVFGTAEGGKAATAKQLQAGRVRMELESGRPNALRIAIWNRRKKQHERFFKARLTLTGGKRKSLPLKKGHAGPGHAWDANFALPALPAGDYQLHVVAHRTDQSFETRIPVRVVPPGKTRSPVVNDPPKKGEHLVPTPEDLEGVILELLPPAGSKVASELPERITVRATDRYGQPVQARVVLWLKSGRLARGGPGIQLGGEITTDSLGLYDFTVLSRRLHLGLRARYRTVGPGGDGPTRKNTYRFDQRTAQAAIEPSGLIVKPGQELAVDIQTKSRSGFLYVETFAGSRRYFVKTQAIDKGRVRMLLAAPKDPGFFRVQATDDFSNPGKGIAVRTLFVDPQGPRATGTLERLARAVLRQLPANDRRSSAHIHALLKAGLLGDANVNRRRAAAYLLSRLDHLHYPTAWLADTSAADTGKLRKRKSRLQGVLVLGLAFTTLLLLGLVIPMIYTNVVFHRRGAVERALLMAEFEGEQAESTDGESWFQQDDEPGGEESPHRAGVALTQAEKARRAAQDERLDRLRHLVQIVMVTGVILLAAGMILFLLVNLSWGWDSSP